MRRAKSLPGHFFKRIKRLSRAFQDDTLRMGWMMLTPRALL